jgi:hypothetical protein
MGFFKLINNNPDAADAAGREIVKVSTAIYDPDPKGAWVPFITDTKKWVFDRGYRYHENDGTLSQAKGGMAAGYTPADVELVVVHDSEKRMHVRVPWQGALTNINAGEIPAMETYTGFPELLARYFMRSCR